MTGSRFWGVVAAAVIGLALAISVGCDDDAKEVCCWCECLLPTGTGGEPELDEQYISGNNLNCESSCQDLCLQEARWRMSKYAKVDCEQMQEAQGEDED